MSKVGAKQLARRETPDTNPRDRWKMKECMNLHKQFNSFGLTVGENHQDRCPSASSYYVRAYKWQCEGCVVPVHWRTSSCACAYAFACVVPVHTSVLFLVLASSRFTDVLFVMLMLMCEPAFIDRLSSREPARNNCPNSNKLVALYTDW